MSDDTDLQGHRVGTLICAHCGWGEIHLGPRGGYVCPQCFHTKTPPEDGD